MNMLIKKNLTGAILLGAVISLTGCGGGEEVVAVNSGGSTTTATSPTTTNPAVTTSTPVVNTTTTDTTTKTNVAPTISGSPALTTKEGDLYSFTPSSADTDNDALSFSIINKPVWMSFNASTGELSGTPSKTDVGDYATIVVSVTDGTVTTSLNSFDVTVKATSATLSWVAPSTRTDGSSLSMTEIAGYKVYIGTSATDLTLTAEITDAYMMEHQINNLAEGTYYFAVSTYSADDIESDLSVVVSKTI